MIELPRLQLSFTTQRDPDDGVWRLYSDDHLGYYLSRVITPGIRKLTEGITSCVVLENQAGGKALAVSAMSVRRLQDSTDAQALSVSVCVRVWAACLCLHERALSRAAGSHGGISLEENIIVSPSTERRPCGRVSVVLYLHEGVLSRAAGTHAGTVLLATRSKKAVPLVRALTLFAISDPLSALVRHGAPLSAA